MIFDKAEEISEIIKWKDKKWFKPNIVIYANFLKGILKMIDLWFDKHVPTFKKNCPEIKFYDLFKKIIYLNC
jgi:hypothetical protein